MNNFIVLLPVH